MLCFYVSYYFGFDKNIINDYIGINLWLWYNECGYYIIIVFFMMFLSFIFSIVFEVYLKKEINWNIVIDIY